MKLSKFLIITIVIVLIRVVDIYLVKSYEVAKTHWHITVCLIGTVNNYDCIDTLKLIIIQNDVGKLNWIYQSKNYWKIGKI